MLHETREQWLAAALAELRPLFAAKGASVPDRIRASCGFPSRRAISDKNRAIGECWQDSASADKTYEIFISPLLSEPARALDILAHEMCHASLPAKTGHGAKFRKLATAIGLTGKMTATVAGPDFLAWAKAPLERLNAYPHAALTPAHKHRKQGTRMVKCECARCGYVVRTTQKWLSEVGAPHCPDHGEMTTEIT